MATLTIRPREEIVTEWREEARVTIAQTEAVIKQLENSIAIHRRRVDSLHQLLMLLGDE